ncbi:MAG: zinc ribbon domain-containing protein [Nitrospirae bacterium]|nr:zinc ribbon domain-containing protein [Nitrospirota bacterium]
MPIYEYRCVKCNHVFDVIQKVTDAPLSECPECDGTLEKCVSGPAIQFKGSGFYITDYTKKGRGPKQGGGGGDDA